MEEGGTEEGKGGVEGEGVDEGWYSIILILFLDPKALLEAHY